MHGVEKVNKLFLFFVLCHCISIWGHLLEQADGKFKTNQGNIYLFNAYQTREWFQEAMRCLWKIKLIVVVTEWSSLESGLSSKWQGKAAC